MKAIKKFLSIWESELIHLCFDKLQYIKTFKQFIFKFCIIFGYNLFTIYLNFALKSIAFKLNSFVVSPFFEVLNIL